jgi:preflagellin peptidase FlaK
MLIEFLMVAVLLASGICAAVYDLCRNVVPNKILLWTLLAEVALGVIYYMGYARDIASEYLINVGAATAVSILLYGFHIWGGGDSKMLIITAIGYPAGLYGYFRSELFPLVNLYAIIFSAGFIFIVIDSIVMFAKKAPVAHIHHTKGDIKGFALDYLISVVYLTAVSGFISAFAPRLFADNPILSVFFNFFLIYCIHSFKAFKKIWVVGIAGAGSIAVWIVYRPTFNIAQLYAYTLSIAVIVIRRQIEKFNYLSVEADNISAGMILSTGTVMQFRGSRIHNLPNDPSESLRNRLTRQQAEAIKKWAVRHPNSSLVVMRKIPFAIFILIGIVVYFVWGVRSANLF